MNRVIHFEVPAEDPENAMEFYSEIFGWKFNQLGQEDYWLAKTGNTDSPGIDGAIIKRKHPDQPVNNNIQVQNLDETIRNIEAKGGSIVVDKITIPGTGHLAFFKDLDGNIFGIMEPLSGQ